MIDLVEKIKAELPLLEVVQAHSVELARAGRRWKGCCPFHNEKTPSFEVREDRGTWKCYGCGLHGDVLNFIAQAKFGSVKVGGEQFVEVLRAGCAAAGLDYDALTAKDDPVAAERRKFKREAEETMTRYAELAVTLWTPELRVRARQRKAYLDELAIEEWGLGVAPTLAQCEKAGISGDELRAVGLLIDYQKDVGASEKETWSRMHFFDSIIIPHWEGGRVTYMGDRALHDGRVRWKGDDEKKTLNMRAPRDDGRGGIALPAGFNFEALWGDQWRLKMSNGDLTGVLLVEARLDAIACCLRGHPAVAYLSAPSDAFVKKLAPYKDVPLYFAPDGTKDVTAYKRAHYACELGHRVKVCCLPAGKDPDDLSAEEIVQLKGEAIPAVRDFLEVIAVAKG